MLIHDLIVAEFVPEDDAVPDGHHAVEEDREEDVVIQAREIRDARQILPDVKLVRDGSEHQEIGETQSALVAGFRRIRAIIRRIGAHGERRERHEDDEQEAEVGVPVVVAETTTDARGESDERLSERRLRVPMIDRVRRHFHVVVQMPNNGDDVFFYGKDKR